MIGEQGVKLDADQTSLGRHGPMLLDVGDETGRRAVGKHHRFPAKGAHLGAADIKSVAKGRKIL